MCIRDSDESHAVTELLNFVTEFERIGDYAVNIMEKAEELYDCLLYTSRCV